MSVIQTAQSFAFYGLGRRLLLLLIAVLVSLLGWCAGYLATLEISPFRMAVIVTAMASVAASG